MVVGTSYYTSVSYMIWMDHVLSLYPYIKTSQGPMDKKIFLPSSEEGCSEEGWVLFIGIWGMADSSVRSIAVAIGREGRGRRRKSHSAVKLA